jgi:hypothetical protein
MIFCLLGGLLASGCAGHSAVFRNHEFGFSALVPDPLPKCIAHTDSHIHGIGTVLVGTECENRPGVPAFSLWADYNSAFAESAIDDLRQNLTCKGAAVGWAKNGLAKAIGGLKTAMCRIDQDNEVSITLEAQGGKWPHQFSEKTARINYTAYFRTTRSRIDSDMDRFRAFLSSIVIAELSKSE